MRRKTNIDVLRLVLACCFVSMLAGCMTTPDRIERNKFTDSAIGYAVADMTGNQANRKFFGERLASEALQSLSSPADGAVLPAWREYRRKLDAPIRLNVQKWSAYPELAMVNKKDRQMIEVAVATSTVIGSEVSEAWRSEQTSVSEKIDSLEKRVTALITSGTQAAGKLNWKKAVADLEEATRLDPERRDLLDYCSKNRTEYATLTCENLLTYYDVKSSARIDALVRAFRSPDSSEKKMSDCLAQVEEIQKNLSQLRRFCQSNDDYRAVLKRFENRLREKEIQVAGWQGRCWGESIRLRGLKSRYWDAYRYLGERMKDVASTRQVSPHQADELKKGLRDDSAKMLLEAMGFYEDKAKRHAVIGNDGVALIFARMAMELCDFATMLKMEQAGVVDWRNWAQDSVKEARQRLGKTMERRVIVEKFEGDEKLTSVLHRRLLDACVRAFTPGKAAKGSQVWAVTLNSESKDAPAAEDYVFSGILENLEVTKLAPRELSRDILRVGQNVTEKPNPAYEKNKDLSPVIFEQDVLEFQKISVEVEQLVDVSLTFRTKHGGRVRPDKNFSHSYPHDGVLSNMLMKGIEVMYDPFGHGQLRTSTNKMDLLVEPLPKGSRVELTQIPKVKTIVLDHVQSEILSWLVAQVEAYPLEDLLAEVGRQQNLGQKVEVAGRLGRCLEYCDQVTGGGGEGNWIERRIDMQKRLTDMSKTIWKQQDDKLRSQIVDIWDISVRAALDTLVE